MSSQNLPLHSNTFGILSRPEPAFSVCTKPPDEEQVHSHMCAVFRFRLKSAIGSPFSHYPIGVLLCVSDWGMRPSCSLKALHARCIGGGAGSG